MIDISEVSELYRQHGWWRDETFLDDLRRAVRVTPDKPAIIAHRDGAIRIVDYAELARVTDTFAARLVSLGVQPGEAVAVQLPSWWELLPIGLACAKIGAIFCPMMAIYRRRELEFILRLTDARICVTMVEWDGARLADTVKELAADLPALEYIFAARGQPPDGTRSFEADFVAAPAPDVSVDGRESSPDEPFLMLFTSGTTGESKGTLHSQNTLYASCSAYAEALGQDDAGITFTSHTATHYSGFVTGLLVPLMMGATAMLLEVWNPQTYVEIAPKYPVTTFYGAPNFLLELLAAQQATNADVSSLRHLVTGSAPIPPSVVQRVTGALGVPVIALWGMTENGAVTIVRQNDPPGWSEHSDGSALGGMEVRLDASAVGESSDGTGAMWVRGPSQCLGYYKRDELYAQALDADGWFDTGDLARPDGRGGYRINGRVKDMVLYRSLNVPVGELENALLRHPQVKDVAVIGLPSEADEITTAVVVPDGQPPTLVALRDHLAAEGFSEWFWPGQVEIIDALPRTITGKVRKMELRQRFGEG
jgi:cyclohexanecarboxylate-CoA ligase